MRLSWDPAKVELQDISGLESPHYKTGYFTSSSISLAISEPSGMADQTVIVRIPVVAVGSVGDNAPISITLVDVVEALTFNVITPQFSAVGETVTIKE